MSGLVYTCSIYSVTFSSQKILFHCFSETKLSFGVLLWSGWGGLSNVFSKSLPNKLNKCFFLFLISHCVVLKVHLKDSEVLFKFLSILWTYSYNLSNQLNYEVSAMLQTQALYIGYALLESQTNQKKKKLVSPSSPGKVKHSIYLSVYLCLSVSHLRTQSQYYLILCSFTIFYTMKDISSYLHLAALSWDSSLPDWLVQL